MGGQCVDERQDVKAFAEAGYAKVTDWTSAVGCEDDDTAIIVDRLCIHCCASMEPFLLSLETAFIDELQTE